TVVARRGAGGHAFRARPAGQRDERHVALSGCDRRRRVGDVDHVRGATGLGGVDVPELEPHVVGHRQPAQPGRVARAEVAVHVGAAEPGGLQRAPRRFGVELSQGLLVGLARGMLEDTGDVGLALDTHGSSRVQVRGELSGRKARPAEVPPLTARTSPVMYSAYGEARNSAAWAISLGTP